MKKICLLIIPVILIFSMFCIPVNAAITEDIEKCYELENDSLSGTYTITTTEIEVKEDKYNYPKDYNYYSILQTEKGVAVLYSKEKLTFTQFNGTVADSITPDKQDTVIVIPFTDYTKAEEFLKGHYTSTQCFKETEPAGEYIRLIHSMNYKSMIYSTNTVINETKELEDFKDTRETKTIGGLTASQITNTMLSELLAILPIILITIFGLTAIYKGINFIIRKIRGA